MIVSNTDSLKINWFPSSETEEIAQNIQTILSTYVFFVPLDRRFGIGTDFIDRPLDKNIESNIQSEVLDAIRKYEPRVEVNSIAVSYDPDNAKANVTVDIAIKEGE